MSEREERPVVTGLLALLAVGLVVGLVIGLATLAATHMLGIGGAASAGASNQQSLYLPMPQKTDPASGPLITLAATGNPSSQAQPTPSQKPVKHKSPKKQISLSASETAVAPMSQIDLTGIYPGGEGAILQVQRFTDGAWQDFPVTASVSNETFSTYVQTSQSGVNRFRVVDTDTKLTSNEVHVTVG